MAMPLLLTCAQPQAQTSVTVYGIVDIGVQYLSKANAAGKSQTSVASGSFLPSRLGFRGQEDLGGGYNAFFLLENGFNADDGSVASAASFFNRFAYVGLGTPYGSVTLGRQGSVQFNKTYLYDPMYFATYSNLSLNAAPISIFKINNAIRYQSPSFNGFNVDLEYGFGQELAGNADAGRYMGASLEYVNGPLSARVLHETTRGSVNGALDQSGLSDRRSSIAAVYRLDQWTLYGNYTRVSGDLQISPRGDIYTAAVAYSPSATWRFVASAGIYDQSGIPGNPKLVNGLVQYSLSKRTSLYAIAGYLKNSANTRYGVAFPATTALAGQNQLGLTLGINHRF
jgi:predicted porin